MRGIDKLCWIILCLGIALLSSCCGKMNLVGFSKRTLNPLQFGLNEACTGVDCYYILQRTHKEASRLGVGVSYAGIKEIVLEIPSDAKSLPLTQYTDFAGVLLKVKNTQKNIHLFSLTSKSTPVEVEGKEIDNRDFSRNTVMRFGRKMLIVEDKTPWVEKRIGYEQGVTRRDILLVNRGKSKNGPVKSYCTPISHPTCYYCDVDDDIKTIKNICFLRSVGSTKKTYFIKVENQYNVELSQVSITTPNGSGLYGDRAIDIANCVKVNIDNVIIRGTYSLIDKYGYGIAMNNVYDIRINNMFARAVWGVFGDNNVHKAALTNCDINRFDVHCYGKDIYFENCNFVDLYNQFSSIYGEIVFKNCTFTSFTPVLIEASFNAFTTFDISFENCIFYFDKNHNSVFSVSNFYKEKNSRPELKEKCLPNIYMQDCQVNLSENVKKWNVYNTNKISGYEGCFSYISRVKIEGLSTNVKPEAMNVFSKSINTSNLIQVVVN